MILGVADDRDPAAIRLHNVALGDGLRCVIRPFAVHIRLEREQQRANGRLRKNDDQVDGTQRRYELGPVFGSENRPLLTLQGPHRLIVVDRDDQHIGFLCRGLEIADVPDVQDVEAAVGERH
jgi:hypothetical protein